MAKNEEFDSELDEKLAGLDADDALNDSVDLSPAEKKKIDAQVKKEIQEELKAEKMKAYKEAAKVAAKRQALFKHGKDENGDDLEVVFVSLASHTPFIALDGKRFYNGQAYRLTAATAAVMKDQMYRGELHENELRGKNMKDFYMHRPLNRMISPHTAINV